MSTVSLCMIVKNEENNIRRCLESAKDAVDEIIIVDTGSSDRTKDICLEYKAKIYDFEWKDDFAKARNFSIDKAASDWILWMDADEELRIRNKESLKNYLENKTTAAYSVKMLHLYGTEAENDRQYYISYNHRLFQNGLDLCFQGAIHEKLIMDKGKEETKICPFLEIMHYGYLEDCIGRKALRNLKLLVKEKASGKEDPWLDYHLAAELYRLNDIERAFQFINQAIAGFLIKGTIPPALVYKLKYDMLLHTGSMENAYKGIDKAIELYPDYVELHFYKGMVLYRMEQYEDALKAFTYCTILGENNPDYLIRSGSGSFYALYYIGECYTQMKKYEAAREAYRQSVLCHPQFEIAKAKFNE